MSGHSISANLASTTEARGKGAMTKMPRVVAIISIVAGAIMIVAGVVTYYVVHRELSDEHIVVSSDAAHFGGNDVKGPFTAYEQAQAIKKHALEIGNGK